MDKSKEPQGSMDKVIALLDEADSSKRLEAIEICAKRRDPEMATPLSGALDDENADVRKAAAWALIKIGTKEAADALITALDSEDSSVRWMAAWGLGEIGNLKAIEPLKGLRNDKTMLLSFGRRMLQRGVLRLDHTLKLSYDPPDRLNRSWAEDAHKSTGKIAKLAIEKIQNRSE